VVGAASAQFNAYYNKNEKDGAEYDENNNRVYKHFSNPQEFLRPSLDLEYGRERRQAGKKAQDAMSRRRPNRPLKKVASRRNNRPSAYAERQPSPAAYTSPAVEIQEARATDRQGYVFNPNQQQNKRQLRPVNKQQSYSEEVPRYQEQQESKFEATRFSAPKTYSSRPVYPAKESAPATYPVYPAKESAPATYQAKPVKEYDFGRKPSRPVEPVYQEPSIEKLNEVYVEPEIVENRYREPQPQRQKIFERNADVVVEDQLEGESFQPAYTPYQPPAAAYDSAYVPVEQKSIEAAVAAGAAAYPGEGYSDPQRLSFQIHGQEGPNSYRFGYDTGVGYNRQFRYEERDNYGVLHGRYGYYDQAGKLQVVNYTADPEAGFHAEGEHVPKPQY
jgi:hypothetical protein